VDGLALRVVLAAGLAAVAAFHAGGAIDAGDASAAAALRDGTAAHRALALGVDLMRLVDVRIGLFRAAHLTAGLLLTAAAAFTAATAARLAGPPAAGLAAALLAGAAVLFGADAGRFGMETGAVAPLLAALAGAAWAWTGARPRPGTGGLLLGAGVAVHPAALLALPGFLLLARGLPSGTRGRAALGLVVGLALIHLPPPGGAWGGAIGAWWGAGGDGAWWRAAGPGDWPEGARRLATVLWRGAGPLALAAGLAGIWMAVRGAGAAGAAATGRALGLTFVPIAAAVVAGARPDPALHAAAAWALALLAAPAIAAAARRMPRVRALLPGVAIVAGAALAWSNRAVLDRSAERDTAWAMDSLAPLPDGSLLLTRNPVHAALSADGARPEVDVRWIAPSTPPGETRDLLRREATGRRVYLDASLFFDVRWRAAALADEFQTIPNGLVFQALAKGRRLKDLESTAWSELHLERDFPASPLRDGLDTKRFYARSLLQCAFLHVELGYETEAEHEFLYALSYPPCNRTLAALGMARIFLKRRQPESAVRTLETYARPEDEGAWNALQVLGSAYAMLRRPEEAIAAYRRALPLVPAPLTGEREKIEQSIAALERRADG
jgi:tetratricopeptide (TPR) repeat protein